MFDIKRTSREALDHARRSLYKPNSVGCGQSPDQEMEVTENGNCDMVAEQAKKCQVSILLFSNVPTFSDRQVWVNSDGIRVYLNDPKFSDKYTWANSADPDQRGAV